MKKLKWDDAASQAADEPLDSSPLGPCASTLPPAIFADKSLAYHSLCGAASPVNFVERIKASLLIVHGDADADVPISQAREMAEALKRAHKDYELIVVPGGDHGFVKKGLAEAMQDAMRFLSARLRSNRSAQRKALTTQSSLK